MFTRMLSLCVLVRERLGEVDPGGARDAGGQGPRRRRLAADDRGVDDRAAAAGPHDRDHRAAQAHRGHELEVDVGLPGDVVEILEALRRRGAGVVEKDVDPTERGCRLLDEAPAARGLRHVGRDRQHLAAGLRAQLRGRGFEMGPAGARRSPLGHLPRESRAAAARPRPSLPPVISATLPSRPRSSMPSSRTDTHPVMASPDPQQGSSGHSVRRRSPGDRSTGAPARRSMNISLT